MKTQYNLSKGANQIKNILLKESINFELEKVFPDLKGKKRTPLRFDFAIYDNKNRLISLVEYDSELHFKFVPKIHKTYTTFIAAQERDRRKNSYCLANNITLYRIPYWELKNIKNFNDILQDKFRVKSKWHIDNLKIPEG